MESKCLHRPAADAQCLFTIALADGRYGTLTEHVETLRLAFRACHDRYPFTMTAGVVLPDHLHCVLSLPPGDTAIAARWRFIQGLFARVRADGGEPWKPGYEQSPLATEADLTRAIDRIHGDPVQHGLARFPKDWPYSSFHAYVAHGLRPQYWRGDAPEWESLRFGRVAA
jgi:putative transposase